MLIIWYWLSSYIRLKTFPNHMHSLTILDNFYFDTVHKGHGGCSTRASYHLSTDVVVKVWMIWVVILVSPHEGDVSMMAWEHRGQKEAGGMAVLVPVPETPIQRGG